MEPTIAGPMPSPSTAWSHLVSNTVEEGSVVPIASAPHRRVDDAAQLRARLLRMIAANEKIRKNAAAESTNQR